jgi:hypothetical protein
MSESQSNIKTACTYIDAGLCVLPAIRTEKRPAIGKWKQFQQRIPTSAELSTWSWDDGLCIICGKVSGNLEVIDFDGGGELLPAWLQSIPDDLRNRLVIESTPSGGSHVIYQCNVPISGNLKLAQRKTDDTIQTLIETRGEGGLFLCAPTSGYELTQGDIADLPILTETERDVLLQAAWQLNEYESESSAPGENVSRTSAHNSDMCKISSHSGHCASNNSHDTTWRTDRPGDDFNKRGDVREWLLKHDWVLDQPGENERWRRPGKSVNHSATLKNGVFSVFSTNAHPFEAQKYYSPFHVYTLLEHGGDFAAAARALSELGYGSDDSASNNDVDLTGILNQCANRKNTESTSDDNLPIVRLKDLITTFNGLHKPIVHGMLREGETMNIIASPKMGKSLLVSGLAISIATGMDWFGMNVEQGQVLHIDNELHVPTITDRYLKITKAMNLSHHLFSDNIDVVCHRGKLKDLVAMGSMFDKIEPGQYKLIIIDAFYRALPQDTDENDNGAIASVYNRIDHYAAKLQCAFAMIHHTSKCNQSGKAVTDVGAGAGSQSRAADTHLVIRPHEEDDIVVLEAAVRSWPAMPPKALRLEWPLFVPTEEVDTSALLGSAKPKSQTKPKSDEITLEAFVDQCIAINDPCSKRSIQYEAGQQLKLSDRKANDMLDLSIERELAARIRIGSQFQYVKCRPGCKGDKALWVGALLAHNPDTDPQEIAEMTGVSERYVRQIRNEK